jgi:hypothetical protein
VVEEPVAKPARSRAVTVLVAVSLALLVQSIGYAMGRSGHVSIALGCFFVGLAGIFLPCAWRLLTPGATRRERVQIVWILGLATVASLYLGYPLMPSGFDDLQHQDTLWNLAQNRSLFQANSLLPVSPHYPALELTTLSVKWLTGVPFVVAELVVVSICRLVLVLAVFLTVERLTRSAFAAGVGVLVFAGDPQFYAFNAAFAYQTIALAFACGAVYFTLRETDTSAPRLSRRLVLPVACLAGVTLSHHLVSWITVALLVVWFAVLHLSGRRAAARVVGAVTLAGAVLVGVWTATSWSLLVGYLEPLLLAAWDGLTGIITGTSTQRALFHSTSGTAAPLWEEAISGFSAVVILGLLCGSLWTVVVRKRLRGGVLRLLPAVVALGYLGVLGSHLVSASAEVGSRASTFVFFGLAVIVGSWYVTRRRPRAWLVAGLALLCLVGSVIIGTGPQWSYVPGPYVPSGDQRALDGPSIAAARWAASNLPEGSRIAADRDNAALMGAVGHQTPITSVGGTNIGELYFAPTWGPFEQTLVYQGKIRYLVVDQRLLDGSPGYGYYFGPGETHGKERLTGGELAKLSKIAGEHLVYDNGPIRIYDVSALLGAALSPPAPRPTSGGGLDLWVFIPFVLTGLIWCLRRRPSLGAEPVLGGLLAFMIVATGGALAVVPSGLPATPVALVALAGWMAWTLSPRGRRPGSIWPLSGEAGGSRGLRALGVALAAALVGSSIGIAVSSALSFWRAPVALSVVGGDQGARIVSAQLGSDPRRATLRVEGRRGVTWQETRTVAGTWNVALPARVAAGASVQLVVSGDVVREVGA